MSAAFSAQLLPPLSISLVTRSRDVSDEVVEKFGVRLGNDEIVVQLVFQVGLRCG